MITIYTLTRNEEIKTQFMIDHYRERFSGCHIVIYDNNSIDRTVEIAKLNNCEIIPYDTNGKLNDSLHMQIKNTCWKKAKTDWVLVCDIDELLDINETQLKEEEGAGSTIISSECWHMINMQDNINLNEMTYGYRNIKDEFTKVYDKKILFNKRYIKEINYTAGAHFINAIGNVKFSRPYKMYHYIFLSEDFYVEKNKRNAESLSDENKQKQYGTACFRTENELRIFYQNIRNQAVKIR